MKRLTSAHKKAISNGLKGKHHSEETKRKISLANKGIQIQYNCDTCGKICEERQSHYKLSKNHFCSVICRSKFIKGKPGNRLGIKMPGWGYTMRKLRIELNSNRSLFS